MERPDNVLSYSVAVADEEALAPEIISERATARAPQADFASETVSAPAPWHPLTRIAFRIAFIYFICFMWLYGNDSIFFNPLIFARWFSDLMNWPLNHIAQFAGRYAFHLTDFPTTWHVTHRGDRMINWVLDELFIFAALAGGLAWTAIAMLRGSRRTEYGTLLAWLRFLLRLAVAFFMIGYGMMKLFPLQMAPISIAVLNEPVGQTSGTTLLWSVIALHPWYQSTCGVAEVIGGTLILFRRTALFGALFSAFVMSNVVLYNLFFDVSVKLFAANLLLAAIFLVLPDAKPLFDFFWGHKPAAQTSIWAPPDTPHGVRFLTRTLEIVFIATLLVVVPLFDGIVWHYERGIARIQSPLLGAWRLDSTHPATGPFITPGGPVTDLYLDTVDRAFRRSKSGTLWRTYVWVDSAPHTLFINDFSGDAVTYAWRMPDGNHLVLTSLPPYRPTQDSKSTNNGKQAFVSAPTVLTLTRTPVPSHYPLFDHSFHFVMQGSRER